MNYTENKLNIVPVTNDTPTLYAQLKSRLASRTDYGIPCFMMPVRLETRFMQDEVNFIEVLPDKTSLVIEAGKDIEQALGLYSTYGKLNKSSARKAVQEITDGAIKYNKIFSSIIVVNPLEKALISKQFGEIDFLKAKLLSGLASTGISVDASILAGMDRQFAQMHSHLRALSDDNSWQRQTSGFISDAGVLNALSLFDSRLSDINEDDEKTPPELLGAYADVFSDLKAFIDDIDIKDEKREYDLLWLWTRLNSLQQLAAIGMERLIANGIPTDDDWSGLFFAIARLRTSWVDKLSPGLRLFTSIPVSTEVAGRVLNKDHITDSLVLESYERLEGIVSNGADILLDPKQTNITERADEFAASMKPVVPLLNNLYPFAADKKTQYLFAVLLDKLNSQYSTVFQGLSKDSSEEAGTLKNALAAVVTKIGVAWQIITGTDLTAQAWSWPGDLVDQLWIRVYPDDIAVSTHEKGLTTAEIEAGKNYWTAWWNAYGDPAQQQAAWRALVNLYGQYRAAWIIRSLTPKNINNVEINLSVIKKPGDHLDTLVAYTEKLKNLVVTGSERAFDGTYLDFVGKNILAVSNSLKKIRSIPAVAAQQLHEKAQDGLKSLQNLGKFTPSYSIQLNGLAAQYSALDGQITQIPVLNDWASIIVGYPVFPDVLVKDGPWTEPAYSAVMPDRFLFAAISEEEGVDQYIFRHIKLGKLIPDQLVLGIDPQNFDSFSLSAINNLQLDDDIKWMVDFTAAVNVGMGIKLTLNAKDAYVEKELGFSRLIVQGVRLEEKVSAPPTGYPSVKAYVSGNAQTLLESLLDGHHYEPDGMAFMQLGTPTNNTEAQDAGYQQPDPLALGSFAIEAGASLISSTGDVLLQQDGQRMAAALGINLSIFQHIEHAGLKQVSHAIAANRSLWPATIGNYMAEMMGSLFTQDNIRRTKELFTDYVIGRGFLPSLRVGKQPYGILPATAFTRWLDQKSFNDADINFTFKDLLPSYSEVSNGLTDLDKFYKAFWDAGIGRENMTDQNNDDYYDNEFEYVGDVPAGGVDTGLYSGSIALSAIPPQMVGYDWYKTHLGDDSDKFFSDRFHSRFGTVLRTLNNLFLEISSIRVKTVDSFPVQQDFMEMLGLDALTDEAYSRYLINNLKYGAADIINNIDFNFNYSDVGGSSNQTPPGKMIEEAKLFWNISTDYPFGASFDYPDIPQEFMSLFQNFDFSAAGTPGNTEGIWDYLKGPYFDKFDQWKKVAYLNATKGLRVFNIKHLDKQYLLRGPFIEEAVLNETNPLSQTSGTNYIQWLLSASPATLWKNNDFPAMKSRTLLFLLLRQSLLLIYRHAAMEVLTNKDVVPDGSLFDSRISKIIGTPQGNVIHLDYTINQRLLTKWHLLFRSINDLRSDDELQYTLSILSRFDGNASSPFSDNSGTLSIPPPGWWSQPLANYVSSAVAIPEAPDFDKAPITELKGAMSTLSTASTAELDRLVREHIDLCSYRLDAWNFGMVNKRLIEQRTINKNGIYIGAYGWLLNVRPKATPMTVVGEDDLPTSLYEGSTVYFDKTNLGFIHTPSIVHALTAAILRSGFISERNLASKMFSVNLSSERVRMALELLEGVRNGQSVNALLGYRFERAMHENHPGLELDSYIYDLRKNLPLSGSVIDPSPTTTEAINVNNVVDGVALIMHYRELLPGLIPAHPDKSLYEVFAEYTDYSSLPAAKKAIIVEVDRIANMLDALSDLAIAEGVFQIANGNHTRSGAVLEALTEGKNPPHPQVIDTPRTGTHLDHKFMAVVKPANSASPWDGVAMTPRALADPSLNAWVASVISAALEVPAGSTAEIFTPTIADLIGARVTYADQAGEDQEFYLTLADLALQPIDLLYLVQDDTFSEEMNKRIAFFTRSNADNYFGSSDMGIPASVMLKIHYTDQGSSTSIASFAQLLALLSALSAAVRNSSFLRPLDFIHTTDVPVDDTVTEFNIADIKSRADSIIQSADAWIVSYDAIPAITLDVAGNSAISTLRDALQKAAALGISFAIPDTAIELFGGGVSLAEMQEAVLQISKTGEQARKEMGKRYAEATSLFTQGNDATAPQHTRVKKYIASLAAILGGEFKALPLFSFDHYPGLRTTLIAQLDGTAGPFDGLLRNYPGAEDEAMQDWLTGLARLRDRVADVETLQLLTLDEDLYPLNVENPLRKIRPVQLPFLIEHDATNTLPAPFGAPYVYMRESAGTETDYWLGAAYPDTFEASENKLISTVINPEPILSGSVCCGMLLDTWAEKIPAKTETTGVAFHYDQPSAKPPQNVLLAVNPRAVGANGSWQVEDLLYTMLDTMDMAKIRMVEPDHFQYLPDSSDATRATSKKFEVLKWVLPAIAGEITPHQVEYVDGAKRHKKYFGKTDSIQQVSFEYNPVNEPSPTSTGTSSTSTGGVINWADIDSDVLLSSEELTQFANIQVITSDIGGLEITLTNFMSSE